MSEVTEVSEEARALVNQFGGDAETQTAPVAESHRALLTYIASLEADKHRLDVLEEIFQRGGISELLKVILNADGKGYRALRSAADAEIKRREGENNG